MSENSFGAKDTLDVGGRAYEIFRLDALQQRFDVQRLPFSLKVLLENLLRTEGNGSVTAPDIEALASWDAKATPSKEIAFTPARVLMQDFTGVPAVVDLAAMRDAIAGMGGDPAKINPLAPAELVIDHSVQVDAFGTRDAFRVNAEREFERNQERYVFLRWGQGAFDDFAVVPPDTGIVHQVNLEYLARVVFPNEKTGQAYPDTLVGTDSHTTMVNGLGVLGWGVGGIEAEAAMLGQPMSMLIPQVLGFRLHGAAARGRYRDRPRADGHRDAARARRRREVRRVLRRRPRRPADRRPRDDRQHVAGVRLDLRDLPDRRRDAHLPRAVRALVRADRAGRGVRQGAGPVARRALRSADVLGHDRARPRERRAEHRRAQAPAGSDRAEPRAELLPRGARRLRHPLRCARRGRRRELSHERPARQRQRRSAAGRRGPELRRSARRGRRDGQDRERRSLHARRRQRGRARSRARRDRRDHELHQHLEPFGDDRRRASSRATRSRVGCAPSPGSRPRSRPARRS